MPILGSFGAASKGGFGRGGKPVYLVEYMIVAGGAGGGGKTPPGGSWENGGGGGGGGVRDVQTKAFPIIIGDTYPVTVGAGGVGGAPNDATVGGFSSIGPAESTGGGNGGPSYNLVNPGVPSGSGTPGIDTYSGRRGGSGGGATREGTGGYGNWTRGCGAAVSPPQGNNGGSSTHQGNQANPAGGGGGFGAAVPGLVETGGVGGTSPVYAGTYSAGGNGRSTPSGAGGANTGDGGDGCPQGGGTGGAGGSGRLVIVRATACSCTTSGCTSTCGCCTIHLYNAPGTYVA